MNTLQFKYTMQMYELRNSHQIYFYFVAILIELTKGILKITSERSPIKSSKFPVTS